jgi:recombinational DNA repair protein RecR
MDLLVKDANVLRNTILSLKSSLPQVDGENRDKQSIGLVIGSTILSGVFGTLMGWFTHRRLNNLRDQISEVKNEQHRLLQIQQITMTRLDALEKVLREVIVEMEQSENTWVNYFALDHARVQLHFHLQKLVRGLQGAHLRRLSVDLLDSKQLCHICDTATKQANAHNYQLMLEHPSDLFQIETLYIQNGQDVNLILHVPMAPPDSIL